MNETNTFKLGIILSFSFLLLVSISCIQQKSNGNEDAIDDKLVDVLTIDSTLVLDLRYASDNNFLGRTMYSIEKCYLLENTARMLAKANSKCREKGLRIKIFDGYRPHSVQKEMWKIMPNPKYVANPETGSHHNRGCAVDVSLVDSLGNELQMPTGFDDFSEKAHHDYMDLPEEAIKNREFLKEVMTAAGFVPLQSEWWHYSSPGCSENEILDFPLK